MLTIPPPLFRPRRKAPKGGSVVPPGPVAPVLTAASFYSTGGLVMLVFDRAVNIAAMDGTQIIVNDQPGSAAKWMGNTNPSLLGPTTVVLPMHPFTGAGSGGLWVTASAITKIVAVNGGGTWAGVTQLTLPFGQ